MCKPSSEASTDHGTDTPVLELAYKSEHVRLAAKPSNEFLGPFGVSRDERKLEFEVVASNEIDLLNDMSTRSSRMKHVVLAWCAKQSGNTRSGRS